MKLAEALIIRADYQKRLEQLKNRVKICVKVQEGDNPPEDPVTLLTEHNMVAKNLVDVIKRINKTNSSTLMNESMTIADTLAERDRILIERDILETLIQAATIKQDRYSKSEIKYLITVDIGEIQKQMDLLSKEYRELDTKIQETNWKIELL